MNDFLSSLQKLVDCKRLQPAERIICDHLINYESILPKTLNEELYLKIETVLINLLSVNNGELSIQCSIRIAVCLLQLYRTKDVSRQSETITDRSEKTWNLYADVAKRPNTANIYATGFITKILGKHFTSKITSFAKNLLNLTKNSKLIQPILYSLNFCFKQARKEMNDKSFFEKTLKLTLKVLQSINNPTPNSITNETEQLLTIRLLKTLINPKSTINLNSATFQKVFSCIKLLMEDDSYFSPFAKDETGFFIAKYLIRDLDIELENDSLYSINIQDKESDSANDKKAEEFENDDFKINTIDKNKEKHEQEKLNKSLSFLLHEFPDQFNNIFLKLLLMVTPSYIHQNIDIFFDFICKNIPDDLPHLIDLISTDDRRKLFYKLESNRDHISSENLFMMKVLSIDHETTNLTAAIAFQMISKRSDNVKDAALNFFNRLSIKSIEISSPYVQASTSFLSTPPDVSQNIRREVKGYSIIAATIISQRPELAYQFRHSIEKTISSGLKNGRILEGHFQAAFTLMASVPKISSEKSDAIKDEIYKDSEISSFFTLKEADKALESFCNYFESNELLTDSGIRNCQSLSAQISMFIVQYPHLKNSTRAMLAIYNNEDLQSLPVHCCTLKVFDELVKNPDSEKFAILASRKIRSLINSSFPPLDFIFHSLKNPMLSPPMLIRSTPIINREIPNVFINIHPNTFAQNAIIYYPQIISNLPNDIGMTFLSVLYMNQLQNYQMSPILLLHLLRNSRTAEMLHEISLKNNTESDNNSLIQNSFLNCLFKTIKGATTLNSFKNKSPSIPTLSTFQGTLKQSSSSSSLCSNASIPLISLSSNADNFIYSCSSTFLMNKIQASLKIQTLSECIALYTSQHEKLYLNPVISQIMKVKQSKEKCFLLAALFTYVKNIPDESIVDMMLELNNIALIKQLQPFALFALMILYQNYMVQLSLIPFTCNQVDFFFSIFQQQNSLSPFALHYLAQSFNALTLILSPEIKTKEDKNSLINSIKNVIFCFANSEVPFSKGEYYQVLRAAFAFERDLIFNKSELNDYLSSNPESDSDSYMYSISTFPSTRGTPLALKTAACGVFSDYAKMIDPTIDFFNLIPQVIMILQTTYDKSASDFIITLVNNFIENSKGNENDTKVRKRLKEWVKLIRLCNSKGVLPGTPDVSSGYSIRFTCTTVAINLLPVLYVSKPLMTDCVDDIITSAIDSLIRNENEYLDNSNNSVLHGNNFSLSNDDLQAECFKLLVNIIDTFDEFIDETGKRILDLYESQFATALRIAFSSSNLAISNNFLSAFLLFHINDLSENESVLNGFIDSMSNLKSLLNFSSSSSKDFTPFESAYLSIASQLVSIARNNENIFEKIKKLTPEFLFYFNRTFLVSRSLWYQNTADLKNVNFDSNESANSDYLSSRWSEISAFRSNFSNYYGKIVSSLVWLLHLFNEKSIPIESNPAENEDEINLSEIVKQDELSYFFISEVIHCKEAWRMNASLDGLGCLVEYKMIDMKLLKQVLHSLLESPRLIQANQFPTFLLACAKSSDNVEIWNDATDLFFQMDQKKHTTLAYLLNNGTTENVLRKSEKFFSIIESSFDDEKALLLLTLLFDKSESKIDDFLIELLKEDSKKSDSFKFSFIYRSLKRNPCRNSMKFIDDFCVSHFMNGGCELMAYVLLKESESNSESGFSCHFFEDERFYEYYEKESLYENAENSENSENSDRKISPSFALKMLQLGYAISTIKQLRNNDRLITCILSFSMNYVAESVTSVELSKKLAKTAALIWREINKNDRMMLKVAFRNIGMEKGRKLMSKIEKASPLREKRTLSLRTFSSNNKLRKLHASNDNWQDLNINDDDL